MTNFEKIKKMCAADDLAAVAELLGAVAELPDYFTSLRCAACAAENDGKCLGGDIADCVLDYENEANEAAWWLNREASDDDWK